jgi:hypothetical protein
VVEILREAGVLGGTAGGGEGVSSRADSKLEVLEDITYNWYYLIRNEFWKWNKFEEKRKIQLEFLLACVPLRRVEVIAV